MTKKTPGTKKKVSRKTKEKKRDTDASKKEFLKHYEKTLHVGMSCRLAGIASRNTYYRWYEQDEKFAEKCRISEHRAKTVVKDEIVRRAIHGINKPQFYKGVKVANVKEYSDYLLDKWAGYSIPEYKISHQKLEHSGNVGLTWANLIDDEND